ncbi:KAT8 regulatory NSL complex subunit 3 isoform X2 [Anopheles cruzii]|uniref:KAT8 regulatory NSL complex subunit 3 isoform X2 n=1 Tax=Anopheles cruzii TaxID=68878 RepID=UPI0022EC2F45|nr:KAT8 regulatory NSL complex subunit 3 isoform X2 [Anopheles cruzii]
MEHSYMREFRVPESNQTSTTRALMIHRPPQCPSCHVHSQDERIDLEESYNPPIPSYNEENARKAMQESENIINVTRKSVTDEDDWEEKVNKFGWSVQQFKLFDRVARLLDMDRLARLTNTDKQHEPVHRRTVIDKSVSRLRQALASVSWETRLTQWLHSLLMENLPPSYLAIYVDLLQTMQAKLPDLANKMVFCHPQNNVGQELLGPILKKPWEPIVANKNRKLPGQPYIIVVPSAPYYAQPSARMQKWYNLFSTMASVIPIPGPTVDGATSKQTLQYLAEKMVADTREKIQEIRKPAPNRPIILVGFNAGAAHAIQIGLIEAVSGVVCLGFAYNTYNGSRGAPCDHICEITSPVLFVIGQNSARSSQEEIEMLRDRMVAQTSLVVVGSADECLRVSKTKRKIEGVTQSMVDNMVADEIAEFATNCLLSPPSSKQCGCDSAAEQKVNGPVLTLNTDLRKDDDTANQRKRKTAADSKGVSKQPRKTASRSSKVSATKGARSTVVPPPTAQEALDMAIQSILPSTPEKQMIGGSKVIEPFNRNAPRADLATVQDSSAAQVISGVASTPIVLPMLKRPPATLISSPPDATGNVNVKLIASNQLIQLKPNVGTTQKFYSLKSSTKPVVSVMSATPTVISGSPDDPTTFSPKKFTIIHKPGETGSASAVSSSTTTTDEASESTTSDLTGTNIFDLPIVFDDGFVADSAPAVTTAEGNKTSPSKLVVSAASVSGTTKPIILSDAIVTPPKALSGNRFVTLQPSTTAGVGKTNKIVVINKGTMKAVDGSMIVPMATKINLSTASSTTGIPGTSGNVIYTKVLLTKPLTTTAGTIGTTITNKNLGQLLTAGKVGIINSVGTAVKPSTSFVINTTKPMTKLVGETQIRSVVSDTASTKVPMITGNRILIKPSVTPTGASPASLLGRNITFKRVNIVSSTTAEAPATSPPKEASKEK